MSPETALAIAGPEAHLVRRTPVVDHVYVGPLTPSGQFAPRSARTVCRAHTRQLRVTPLHERSPSLARCAAISSRVCARCAARLVRDRDRARRAAPLPTHRDEWADRYAGTTRADLALALELATTPAEVDDCAWVSLLLFDVAGCATDFVEHGRAWPSLHRLTTAARTRVRGYPESYYRDHQLEREFSEIGNAARKARGKAAHAERQAHIAAVGFNNAVPVDPRRRRPV